MAIFSDLKFIFLPGITFIRREGREGGGNEGSKQ